ncbi:3'-5' exonuclease [Chloroflexus sp. Y-396-1]|uniref:3'-5' exonuclease n=1 Tax=Chloroflexus sp. Y-396-1 TaxID=867845 RepID=UPI00048C2E16|nr:3'-5' exonuclease [Chloroflexus sp. Y-396-1]
MAFWSRFFQRIPPANFVRAYQAFPEPDPKLPWREVPYTVIDVETTGLDPRHDALIAIGAVNVENGRVLLKQTWYSLIRPPADREPSVESIRIHHLTPEELQHAPPPAEVLAELLQRIAGRVLVVHVAQVDVRFINAALRPFGGRLRRPILDTARLALTLHLSARWSGEQPHDMPDPAIELRALATALGLPVYAQHNALNDAVTTAQLFIAQATILADQGRNNLAGLIRAGGV